MKAKQYPPQTGPYIVKVKTGQSTDPWQHFSVARLQISVGQEYHEGKKFSCLIDWCNDRFEKITICANDSLQRFNIMFEKDLDEKDAEKESLDLGKQWLERAMPSISGVSSARVMRWDEWKAKKDFPKGRLSIEWLYQNNDEFKAAIDQNINEIWSRRASTMPARYTPQNYTRFFELSKYYLLEETAVFASMFEHEEGIDIYPGTVLFAATLFKGRDVKGAPSGLGKGHFCRIDFSRNNKYENKLE